MINKSDSIVEISKALLNFQKSISKVTKDSSNPFFKSKYASLSIILDTIKKPLIDNGLVFTQFPVSENKLCTILIHTESGEYFEGTYKMTPSKNDPQGQGSVITYQRRYALGAILGLNIDEDDDGNKASGNTYQKNSYTKNSYVTPQVNKQQLCTIHNVPLAANGNVLVCPVPNCNFQIPA